MKKGTVRLLSSAGAMQGVVLPPIIHQLSTKRKVPCQAPDRQECLSHPGSPHARPRILAITGRNPSAIA